MNPLKSDNDSSKTPDSNQETLIPPKIEEPILPNTPTLDILDECLPPTSKLNLTSDEKDELDDLNNPENEAEYEDFLNSLNQNEQTKNLLSQFSNMFNFEGNPDLKNEQNPFLNFGNSTENNTNFDDMTNTMLDNFLQKDVIYEPLLEAKTKLGPLINREAKNDEEAKKIANDKKIYGLVLELIDLFDKPDHTSKENKEIIMAKFEELHDLGGLPTEIMADSMKECPPMGEFNKLKDQCSIF